MEKDSQRDVNLYFLRQSSLSCRIESKSENMRILGGFQESVFKDRL